MRKPLNNKQYYVQALLAAVLAAAALLLCAPPLEAQQVVTVEAQGLSSYRPDDAARSRSEALEAALRDAVEQASGLIVTAESELRNFDLVRDEVLSRSEGYIQGYDVVSEGQDGMLYRLTLRAQVVKAAFIQGLNDSLDALYRRVGRPRLLVLVSSQGIGADGALTVEKAVQSALLAEGFAFVDKASLGLTAADSPARVAQSSTGKAELLLRGKAELDSPGERDGFHRVDARVSLEVLRADSGQLLAAGLGTGRGLHPDAGRARNDALAKGTNSAVPPLLEQVSYQWLKERNEGAAIVVRVQGVSYGQALAVRRDLGNRVAGVNGVKQRSFQDDVLELELQSSRGADRLAEAILAATFDGYGLQVKGVGESTVDLQWSQP